MIHVETSHLVTSSADFPDDFKILNGDGMTAIKNPATNEIIFQAPTASTLIYKKPNPPEPNLSMPVPTDVPPSMQGGEDNA